MNPKAKRVVRQYRLSNSINQNTASLERIPSFVEGERILEPIKNLEPRSCFVVPYDETLLDVCRTRWQFGDWARLITTDTANLIHHPHRAQIALLVAAGHFQLGLLQQAHRLLQTAMDWGASRPQVSQILISGIHNSLAEAYLAIENTASAREHFQKSIRNGGIPGDIDLLAQAREAQRAE